MEELNKIAFYELSPPKSLGREWVEKEFFPLVSNSNYNFTDLLRTIYEHIAIQIGKSLQDISNSLVTGGGAFNTFLIERIKANTNAEIILPGTEIINYKEALIFALLGVLRIQNKINCLSSVTGAGKDSCCGVIDYPQ